MLIPLLFVVTALLATATSSFSRQTWKKDAIYSDRAHLTPPAASPKREIPKSKGPKYNFYGLRTISDDWEREHVGMYSLNRLFNLAFSITPGFFKKPRPIFQSSIPLKAPSQEIQEKIEISKAYMTASYCPRAEEMIDTEFPQMKIGKLPVAKRPWDKMIHFEPNLPSIAYMISVDHETKRIIIIFRGAFKLNMQKAFIRMNLKGYPVNNKIKRGILNNEVPKVHNGIYNGYFNEKKTFMQTLMKTVKANEGYNFWVTGFCYGAAQALYAALDITRYFKERELVVVTFGSVRPGNRTFAKYVNYMLNGRVFRVTNYADGYPHLPRYEFGYVHAGPEFWYSEPSNRPVECAEGEFEDARCSASKYKEVSGSQHFQYFAWNVCKPGEGWESDVEMDRLLAKGLIHKE